MSSVDPTSERLDAPVERKRWETPTVILGTARRNTLSALNTVGPDGQSVGGFSYGS